MTSQYQNHSDRQRGYTVIEVMIVVALIGIITAIAVPQFQRTMSGTRVRTTTDALLHDLLLVKANARELGGSIVICKSDNPEAALPACSATVSNPLGNTGWASGWIAFKDLNGNTQYDAGENLLFVQPSTMRSFGEGSVVPNPNVQALTFNATGQNTGGAVQFFVKGNDAADSSRDRYVCVGIGGRILVSKTAACN